MQGNDKFIKATSYVAGFFTIASAMLLLFFLIMSVIGLIHPRKERITLHTDSLTKTYDGVQLQGSMPVVSHGSLHAGHRMEVRNLPVYTQVGVYANVAEVVILDGSGMDVTAQYDIVYDYGEITIETREIALYSAKKRKIYDGTPLVADAPSLSYGALAPGHTLVSERYSLLFPGEVPIRPTYRILSEDGVDVTDQYAITEYFETLQIMPIIVDIYTGSAQKIYDGMPLTADTLENVGTTLLEGHELHMEFTASLSNVGSITNEGYAWILDENGNDVSHIYELNYHFGTLKIEPIPLYITTMSAKKIYDGTPLRCEEWELTDGILEDGAVIHVQECAVQNDIGKADNVLRFSVADRNGTDISARYTIICDYGTLSVQPRAITIRTGSAVKVYDGTSLSCNTFEIISGSLCQGEYIQLVCTSIHKVGMSENYVLDCSVYRVAEDGSVTDVSACYRITFDYGILEITAK